MITKEQAKLISKVYKDIRYALYTDGYTYQLDEILKINKQEEKAHRGTADWEDYHDTNATVNLMAKLILCEKIIEGALLGIDANKPVFTAYDMEHSNGMNRAKALGIRHADTIKDNLNASDIGEFRQLEYANIVSKEVQPYPTMHNSKLRHLKFS